MLAYFGFCYLSIQENQKPPEPRPQEADESSKPKIIEDQGPAILDLSDKGLVKVPEYVFGREELTELDLSGNVLDGALPAEIRYLKNLKKLNVSNNQMTRIPAEIGQLGLLEVLDYSNNQITGLPLEIGNLKKLITFNLSGNDYSEFDLEKITQKLPDLKVITD